MKYFDLLSRCEKWSEIENSSIAGWTLGRCSGQKEHNIGVKLSLSI